MGKGFNVLSLFKPAVALLPEVAAPDRKIAFKTRAMWTAIVVMIYLVCS